MTSETSEITAEQARQALESDRAARLAACRKEIEPLMQQIEEAAQKHGCVFGPRPFIAPDGRIAAQMVLDIAN
jgi:hypothetical protein